jgi:hypothetical protein
MIPKVTTNGDNRVTAFGKFMRKTTSTNFLNFLMYWRGTSIDDSLCAHNYLLLYQTQIFWICIALKTITTVLLQRGTVAQDNSNL